jgi:hypothetical protein
MGLNSVFLSTWDCPCANKAGIWKNSWSKLRGCAGPRMRILPPTRLQTGAAGARICQQRIHALEVAPPLKANCVRRIRRLRTMSAGGAAEEFISRLTRPVLRPFENPRLECYKSDLRHALNFAVSGKTAGVPGRGSRPWHGFLFRSGSGFQGLYLQALDRKGAII